MTAHTRTLAGAWITNKIRRQQATVGTLQAARNCRKQGLPIALALAILIGRTEQ